MHRLFVSFIWQGIKTRFTADLLCQRWKLTGIQHPGQDWIQESVRGWTANGSRKKRWFLLERTQIYSAVAQRNCLNQFTKIYRNSDCGWEVNVSGILVSAWNAQTFAACHNLWKKSRHTWRFQWSDGNLSGKFWIPSSHAENLFPTCFVRESDVRVQRAHVSALPTQIRSSDGS